MFVNILIKLHLRENYFKGILFFEKIKKNFDYYGYERNRLYYKEMGNGQKKELL